MTKLFFAAIICLFAVANIHAQAKHETLVFSAIKGKTSKLDTIELPANGYIQKKEGDTSAFTITTVKNRAVIFFAPAADFTGIARAVIDIKNTAHKNIVSIDVTGLGTKGLEGENEAPLSTIADALGYQVNIGWPGLANHSRPEMQGDELNASLFRKAGNEKVEMIPVARYSPDFELPFGYYIDEKSQPQKKEVGILAKAGAYPEHQLLFPAIETGSKSFDPGTQTFGFYATGPTHTAYSEDVWNMLLFPANAVHATRIYPLKDKTGKLLVNTYLLCFEEAKNGDYNDYVFLVKNISPVTTPFTQIFNGKNLDGWHTFMKGIGTNTDPGNNFTIEDGSLHVLGKELGYAITDKGYNCFHFKVDFKWGEKRWPPRENNKRDAGVCYNIPMDEPDSIWPRSIECQIQEGDVGDFWLLGFTKIKVNGVVNVPANHTRMIKQKDAEKPNGEWNTLEIISCNGKCVQVVNGVVVNVGEEATVTGGRLLLQSEYSEIYYRNVKIRQL